MHVTLGCVAYARPERPSCSRFLDRDPLLRGPASNAAAVTIALAHGLSPPVPLQALRAEPHALLSRAKCQSCFSRAKPAPRLLPTLLLSGPVVSRAVGRTKPCPVQTKPCPVPIWSHKQPWTTSGPGRQHRLPHSPFHLCKPANGPFSLSFVGCYPFFRDRPAPRPLPSLSLFFSWALP